MENKKTLHQKLVEIQQNLKAPKGQFNEFGNYKYRSCEDILEAVKPLLKEREMLISIQDEMIQLGERYYIKSTVEVTDGKEIKTTTAYAREPQSKKGMDESQITGASSSYARKYAINGMFAIDDTKDADTQDNTEKPETQDNTEKPNPIEIITKKIEQCDNIEKLNKMEEWVKKSVKNSAPFLKQIEKKRDKLIDIPIIED
jgi:hypothetical protein